MTTPDFCAQVLYDIAF